MARSWTPATAVAALLLLGSIGTARADILWGVSASTDTVSSFAQPGCGVNPSYTTAGGGSVSQSTGAPGCSISDSVPTPSGLSSASVQSKASSTYSGDGSTISASASATADLTTASLHATADAPVGGPSPPEASANASWLDTLTFIVAGATATTVTEIPVIFKVDGTASGGSLDGAGTGVPSGPATELTVGATVQILSGPNSCLASQSIGCLGPPFGAPGEAEWQSHLDTNPAADSITTGADSSIWSAPTVDTASDFTIAGILTVTGTEGVFNVAADLNLDAGYGTLNYGDTAGLSFDLPNGVTVTSASGVFAKPASPVPEPGSLSLFAGAAMAFGVIRRRRRRDHPCRRSGVAMSQMS
jgi:hypothetical protein